MLKVYFYTLGCKLNQFETIYMAQCLEKKGMKIASFPSKSDIYIINSCTVTEKSEKHSFQAVRKANRANHNGIIVVTGCAAQVSPQAFCSIKGVDWIIGNPEKLNIHHFLENLQKAERPQVSVNGFIKPVNTLSPMIIEGFSGYTRAFIKIQDGCDAKCSYCIVPKARGPSSSFSVNDIIYQANRLWGEGYREIVLTGINLGQYGKGLEPACELSDLLDVLLKDKGQDVLRLSSIEPTEFNQRLLRHIKSSYALCSHYHIPLQSGSNKILKKMGRGYSAETFSDLIHSIIDYSPFAALGTDVIVGFPGETDKDFEMTYRLLENLPLAYFHIFSFSPRPGTLAAKIPDQVNHAIKKHRSLLLRTLSQKKKVMFRQGFINKELEALVLKQNYINSRKIYSIALTGNYIPVYVEAKNGLHNKRVIIKIDSVDQEKTWGRITKIIN